MKNATPGSGTTRTGMDALPPRAQDDPLQVQDDPPRAQADPLCAQVDPPQVQDLPLTQAQAGHPRRSREDQTHRPRCGAQRAGSVSRTSSLPRQHHQVKDQHHHFQGHPRNVKVIIPKTSFICNTKRLHKVVFFTDPPYFQYQNEKRVAANQPELLFNVKRLLVG